jgi:chitinase
MVMEFGGPSPDYGDQIIGAIKSTLRQMKAIWPSKTDGQLRRMLGATPMLGKNFNQKVFETKHARRLVEWANNNHIGFLGFWSIGRDNGGCSGQISPSCSGTSQSEYEFTKIFQDFKA